MVGWLFVGSSLFAAVFACLGGSALIEQWVLSSGLTPFQFFWLAQIMIFLLGWPLEWTEITIIFLPLFLPLLKTYDIDPLFFGIMTALNQQTSFLSPPGRDVRVLPQGRRATQRHHQPDLPRHVPVPGDSRWS